MEAAPAQIDVNKVESSLLAIKGVVGVHSLRVWALKADSTAISVHVETSKDVDLNNVVYEANTLLQVEYGIDFVTVQAQCSNKSRSNSVSLEFNCEKM